MIDVIDRIRDIVGDSRIFPEESLKNYTTFRIGGKCRALVMPSTKEEIIKVVSLLRETKTNFFVMGNGSNLLVSDEGFDGIVVSLKFFKGIEVLEEDDKTFTVRVMAGELMSSVGNYLARQGVEGFEFATGIPGTIGGGVRMNAGAYGGELKDILVNITAIAEDNTVVTLSNEELELSYRTSILAKKNYICLDACFKLNKGDSLDIKAKIKEYANSRKEKQPLNYPSAGSTFKRPEGYIAAKLIDEAGLKGLQVGGAKVSEKHAGFVVNVGGATAKDVIELTDRVKEVVKEKNGVSLELEVVKLGF
jgi:UDP-N-acetylmuramate dehydrogenase